MGVLLRHTLRSSGRNKFQTLVVLFTVIIVTAILFISMSSSDIFSTIIVNEYQRISVDADIAVGSLGGGAMYSKATVEKVLENDSNIESIHYFLRSYAITKTQADNFYVYVEATDLKSFVKEENGFYLITEQSSTTLPNAIISEKFSSTYGLGLGDTLEIISPISGNSIAFMVTHIMATDGFFGSATVNSILVDIADVESMGMVNNSLITLKNKDLYDTTVDALKEALPFVEVGSAYPEQLVAELSERTTRLFVIALIFVIAIMLVILSTSYLIVLKNRMNEMAVFKAVGATPLNTTVILILEALFYGIIGAILGTIVGRLAMGYLLDRFLPYADGIIYNIWKYAVTLILGTMTSIIAALPPIVTYSKKSIRELTEKGEKHLRLYNPKLVVAVTLAAISMLTTMLLVDNEIAFIVIAALTLPLLILDIAIGSPYLIRGAAYVFSKIFKTGIAQLSTFGIKRNNSTQLLSVLIVVVISFSFLFVSVINIVISSVDPYNTRYSADVVVSCTTEVDATTAKAYEDRIIAMDNVSSAASYASNSFQVYLDNQRLDYTVQTHGIVDIDTIPYIVTDIDPEVVALFENTKNGIIFNYDHAQRLGLGIGDTIKLGSYIRTTTDELEFVLDTEFVIIGLENTVKDWTETAIVHREALVLNGKELQSPTTVLVDIDNMDSFDIKAFDTALFDTEKGYAILYGNWAYATSSDIQGLINLLYVLEGIFIAIAILGIVNVTIVATLDRKREYYLLRCTGLDYKGYIALSSYEGLLIGIAAAIGGLITGLYLSALVPSLATLVDKYTAFPLFPYELAVVAFGGIALYTLIKTIIAAATKRFFLEDKYSSTKV